MNEAALSRSSCIATSGGLRRLALSLAAIAGSLCLMLFGPAADTANASGLAEDPASEFFPALPGSRPVQLAGEITVNGRALSTSIVRLDSSPDEVIASLRRHYEELPVDLVEEVREERRILTVWDIHRGRRLLLSAQRLPSGGTELIRSWSPLQPDASRQVSSLPRLPGDLRPLSRIEDRLGGVHVTTSSYVSEREVEALERDLSDRLRAQGWVGGRVRSSPDAPERLLHFQQGDQQLLAALQTGQGLGTIVSLRVDRNLDGAAEGSGP